MTKKSLSIQINEVEFRLAQFKAVQQAFPDANYNSWGSYGTFVSKTVNSTYTKFVFEKDYGGLYILVFSEVLFDFNNKQYAVKVYSTPRRCRLAYLSCRRGKDGRRIMKFSRLKINMKKNSFKDEILNDCQSEIMLFIKNNPDYSLDTTHLDARLKKIVSFV